MIIKAFIAVTITIFILSGCNSVTDKPSSLRSDYILTDKSEIKSTVKAKNLFDYRHNRYGGFNPVFSVSVNDNKKVISISRYRLMWAAEGSLFMMSFTDAEKWIKSLNDNKYAGYSNWRLPTVEEAALLLRKQLNSHKLFTYEDFSPVQRFIWTGDSYSENIRWVVSFSFGSITTDSINGNEYVRPVRTIN